MGVRRTDKLCLGLATALVMLVAAPADSALASARVRLVNADGGGPITLRLTVAGASTSAGGPVQFGAAGQMATVPAGEARLSVGGKTAMTRLADGAGYTVVALPKGAPRVLRNGSAVPRQARMRIVHAAPELGSPDIRLGKRTIAQAVKPGAASPYLTLDPGSYPLAVTKPNGGPALFKRTVALAAGTANTVVIAGSGGSPERIIVASDDTVTPVGAPRTGLGGLARRAGAPWLAALLAALVAGGLGCAIQLGRTRRARP